MSLLKTSHRNTPSPITREKSARGLPVEATIHHRYVGIYTYPSDLIPVIKNCMKSSLRRMSFVPMMSEIIDSDSQCDGHRSEDSGIRLLIVDSNPETRGPKTDKGCAAAIEKGLARLTLTGIRNDGFWLIAHTTTPACFFSCSFCIKRSVAALSMMLQMNDISTLVYVS